MTLEERADYLIRYLLDEREEYQGIALPSSLEEKRRLLRSLMNVRPPAPVSEAFLDVQGAYLEERLAERGITSLNDLTPVRPGLYLWQGDITTLAVDAIVNAANSRTITFYKEHGARHINKAFETLLQTGNTPDLLSVALMQCRHCVRHTLGLCPKQYGKDPIKKEKFKRMNGGRMKPQPLVLTASGGTRLLARFDCRSCEMTVSLIPKNMSAEELKNLDVGNMTPIDALNTIYRLQNRLRNRW